MLQVQTIDPRPMRPRAAGALGLLAALLCAAALAPSAADEPRPAEEIMPAGEGVEAVLPASVYPGDYLFDYIDGGAPQYIEYGFREVASLELKLAGHTYVFDVYRMASPLAAWGIFSTRRPAGAPLLGDFPYSSFTTYQGMAAHGPYFFDISAFETGDATAAEMARLLSLATSKVDASSVPTDIVAGEPFVRLPGNGRLPGSERLARGPISLRAALGGTARGSLQTVLDAVQRAMETQALRAASPRGAAGSGDGAGGASDGDRRGTAAGDRSRPWWVVCGYHPIAGDDGRLEPQTTLVLLAAEGDVTPWLQAAGEAVIGAGGVQALADRGWRWSEADGRQGFVLRRGGDLLCATSVLQAELLDAWSQSLLTQ